MLTNTPPSSIADAQATWHESCSHICKADGACAVIGESRQACANYHGRDPHMARVTRRGKRVRDFSHVHIQIPASSFKTHIHTRPSHKPSSLHTALKAIHTRPAKCTPHASLHRNPLDPPLLTACLPEQNTFYISTFAHIATPTEPTLRYHPLQLCPGMHVLCNAH